MNRAAISIGLTSIAISLLFSTGARSQGIVGKPVDPKYDKMPEDLLYSEHYCNEVCANTPRIHSSSSNDGDWVMIDVKVNAKGIWESFKISKISTLQKLDWWTIWATATCPPIYPGTNLSFPTGTTVGNRPECGESTANEEFSRNALGKIVEGLKSENDIVFPLIPVSIAWIYPNTCTKEELISAKNLVAIPASLLPPKAQWTTARANEWIKTGPLKDLLSEWHGFFIGNEKPSRTEIFDFAQLLKKKYQKVLKEVRGRQVPPSR